MTSAARQSNPVWLDELRGSAPPFALPARGTERYRFLEWKPFESVNWQPLSAAGAVDAASIPMDLPGARLVFVDGHLAPQLSRLEDLPAGVTLVPFSKVDGADLTALRSELGSQVAPAANPFAALNLAELADGVYLRVARDVAVRDPIYVLWLSGSAPAAASAARVLVVLEAGARAMLVEQFAEIGGQSSRVSSVTELRIQDNARLEYSRLQNAANGVHFGACNAAVAAGGHFKGFYYGGGSPLCRVDATVDFTGRGAFAELGGVYMPGAGQQVDYHTNLEHRVPDCGASEVFRGLVGAGGRAIFNGRIHIHRDAQKSNSELSNKNLLLSEKAEIYTKPELEIYADDVKCAHGATVAQLNDEGLHYLRSRGVGLEEARSLLSFGFVNEVVEGIEYEPVRDCVEAAMRAQFARLHRESEA